MEKTFVYRKYISIPFASLTILMGALVLLGWQLNIDVMKSPIPKTVAMNPLTALSFITLGTSFLILSAEKKRVVKLYLGYIMAGGVIVIGLLRLAGIIFPSMWQVDTVFYGDEIISDSFERNIISNMAMNTALCFILSGVSLLTLHIETKNQRIPSQVISLLVFTFGFFSLLGYLYKAPEFYSFLKKLPMAIHTSVCFLLFPFSVFFLYPNKGFISNFTSTLLGSQVGRVLIPSAFLVPILLGVFQLHLSRTLLLSLEFSTTLLVLSIVTVLCALIFYNIKLLNNKDHLKTKTEEKFKSLLESAPDAMVIVDETGSIQLVNGQTEKVFGYSRNQLIGKKVEVLMPSRFQKNHTNHRGNFFANPKIREMGAGLELYGRKKNGSEFPIEISLSPLETEEGILVSAAMRDITERKNAELILKEFNEELTKQVNDQTGKIKETTAQLRQLAAHLQTVREEEKKYIAREMHDELGQMLTGLRMDLVWLRKKINTSDEKIASRFERTLELLNETKEAMRSISRNLHPATLNDLGLTTALQLHCEDFENRSGIKTTFISELPTKEDTKLPSDVSIGIYRVLQESLNNIAKHANATHVATSLKKEGDDLTLSIEDNGRGFVQSTISKKRTLGLISNRERAMMMGGNYYIRSKPGKGTSVSLTLPLT